VVLPRCPAAGTAGETDQAGGNRRMASGLDMKSKLIHIKVVSGQLDGSRLMASSMITIHVQEEK
jgi:hypothetical protein